MHKFKTVSQVADEFGCSKDAVYKKANSGEIASHKLFGRLCFSQEDLDAWVESTRRKAV